MTTATWTKEGINSHFEARGESSSKIAFPANHQAPAASLDQPNVALSQPKILRTAATRHQSDGLESAIAVGWIERWLAKNVGSPKSPKIPATSPPHSFSVKDWLSPKTIAEAKLRFKDALEEAEEEEIPTPSDSALSNALRAVQMIDDHCPQGLSSVAVMEEGMMATARGASLNYISVECEENGEVLVMFNVRSYARYKDMDEAERAGFLKALLETLRY